MSLGLNDHHDGLVLNYLRFMRFQRNQCLKSIKNSFVDAKDTRLLDDTYTRDEIDEVWEDVKTIVSGDVESELIASSHTNVLLLKQVFVQAQKWHLNLDADLDELENRELLDQVKRWEDSELKDTQVDRPPAYLTAPLKKSTLGKLAPINCQPPPPSNGQSDNYASPGVRLLNNRISTLEEENKALRERVLLLEHEGSAAKEDAQEDSANCDITKAGSAEQDVVESAAAATAAANASEIEELTQAFKQVKTKLADELESNCQEKKELETNLVSTTHQLLEVKHNLSLAEKELEKKFSQTGAYKNLKKMLQQKNDVIKDLRIKLQKYDEQNMDHHSESE